MQITVELPDELVSQMVPAGQDPSRAALEGFALEAFRAHRITDHELAGLLETARQLQNKRKEELARAGE